MSHLQPQGPLLAAQTRSPARELVGQRWRHHLALGQLLWAELAAAQICQGQKQAEHEAVQTWLVADCTPPQLVEVGMQLAAEQLARVAQRKLLAGLAAGQLPSTAPQKARQVQLAGRRQNWVQAAAQTHHQLRQQLVHQRPSRGCAPSVAQRHRCWQEH